jgi:hypothetical protein
VEGELGWSGNLLAKVKGQRGLEEGVRFGKMEENKGGK